MESTTYSRVAGFTAPPPPQNAAQTRGLASLLGWKGVKEESRVDAEEAALDALCRSLILDIQ